MTTSIVTSMYNKMHYKIELLDFMLFSSLLSNASSDKELIILDDCSPLEKETKHLVEKYLPELKQKFGNVVFQRNPSNFGFSKSFNRGIELANGENLLITNDDVYFPAATIDSLILTLQSSPDYGMVGPITNQKSCWTYQYCRQAPKIRDYSGGELKRIEDFAQFIRRLAGKKIIETDVVFGFCFALKREVIEEAGVFDESFVFGSFEDTDFARRVAEKYKLIVDTSVYIHHGGLEGTHSSFNQHTLKSAVSFVANAYRHGKKWGHAKTAHHILRGLYRTTGRNTISEDIERLSNMYKL